MDYRQESMVNIAFEILTKSAGAMSFYDIWKEVAEKKEFDEEQKDDNESLFYTNMILDGRMITVGENKWDLRTRHRFEEVHIDMNDIYNEDESEESAEEEDEGLVEDNYGEEEYGEILILQIVDKLDENINWAIPNWYFHFLLA